MFSYVFSMTKWVKQFKLNCKQGSPYRIVNISGLDPAGYRFESKHSSVRLDKGDAKYVDVIHTDGEPLTSLGKIEVVGFYKLASLKKKPGEVTITIFI